MKNIYVYSIGHFNELPAIFFEGKVIIRIHDISNINFFNHKIDNGIVQFFNDTVPKKKSCWEKFLTVLKMSEYEDNFISVKQAKELCEFIVKNQTKDYVIHCTYRHSRSVAIADFIQSNFPYKIVNKTP